MRAIGKGSLSSILAVGLHVMRVILWIMFSGLTVAMVVIPLGAFVFDSFHVGADRYFSVTNAFVTTGVTLFVVNRLLEIMKTLRFGSPFVRENADRFRAVGFALLIGEGAKIAFGFLSLIFDADVEIDVSAITWLAIVAVFVLSEVFREGARMKEEQDLTV